MKPKNMGQINFFTEMSEHQISAQEFFGNVLLESIKRNFGLKKIVIFFFDVQGKFLSLINSEDTKKNDTKHPYKEFVLIDIIRHIIFQDAVRDKLTYFDVTPRIYKSTDIISKSDYNKSSYVEFLEKNFNAHYSLTVPFGINAYIQVSFFKSYDEGDFSEEETEELKKIYVYIANSYKNFKKYEQAKIIANIQNEIIASGEKAYLITDDFMHILSYNELAKDYLKDIFGEAVTEQINSEIPCYWLPFLLGDDMSNDEKDIKTRIIKNCIFKIYTYNQTYSNGIVDKYHWITISQKIPIKKEFSSSEDKLTKTEERIVELLHKGLTYKEISNELVVSYHTVKKHIQNIYTKCGVNSRFELYKWIEERE